jgi:valyl-tRNA synthetase
MRKKMELPKKYNPKESESKWQKYWEEKRTYKFDEESKAEIYSVDTPPPTVSGRMHIGHAFSFAQQDFMVRFQRMIGKNIFFPFGTDDNGIPTEKLVEKMHKVRATKMPRSEFTALCLETIEKNKDEFVQDWKNIGMSCDWDISFSTIDKDSQIISQKSFIDLYKKGREYRKDAPALFCPGCQTAVSQVECEDKELDSTFNDIIFKIEGEDVIIGTTRPELLPACVAVFYNPDDERYKKYEGKKAKVPLFDFEVEVLADKRVNLEKGTGLVMCCTFGDQTDMEWYFAYNLKLKEAFTKYGKMSELAGEYEGMKIKDARIKILEDLDSKKLLVQKKQIKHSVNVHERCGREIEIMHSKQWFIKYLDIKEDLLKWGTELNWYPKHMKVRYDHWVKGLQWDWLISRQRFHGIPFPVWYCKDCEEVILADEKDLPVDPSKDSAPASKCPKCECKEIIGDMDVMDTWATSSLSPQLAIERYKDKPFYKKLYPMNLRPQAHDIITFWLFNTVVKSRLHNDVNPWKDVVISGHALDPKGKKMSKSKGNVVNPQKMLDQYSADALRFWAAGSKLGDDLPFQEKDLFTGLKFTTKLWNASKFVIMNLVGYKPKKPKSFEKIDLWLLTKLNKIIESATNSFKKYEYSKTKQETEKFFWQIFCDYYLELVKDRIYNPENYSKESIESVKYTLYTGLLSVLKLIAPIMPYITEEIYHLYFVNLEKEKSIHNTLWPKYDAEQVEELSEKLGDFAVEAVGVVRRAKTEKQVSLKTQVKRLVLKSKLSPTDIELVKQDIIAATKTENFEYEMLDEKSKIDFEHVIDFE